MKKIAAVLLSLLLVLAACAATADGWTVSAQSSGTLQAIDARPNQKLALRSGPGTKYTEIFSIGASEVWNFALYQQEKGGSAMWGMIEFDSSYGRYRVYTGMKRIDTNASVPMGNKDGVVCYVGGYGAQAYYGPGRGYASVDDLVPAGTKITVYHEEQGYVMADFVMPGAKDDQYDSDEKQITRAWIDVDDLSGYSSAEWNGGWYDGGYWEGDNQYDADGGYNGEYDWVEDDNNWFDDWYNNWPNDWNGEWEEVG